MVLKNIAVVSIKKVKKVLRKVEAYINRKKTLRKGKWKCIKKLNEKERDSSMDNNSNIEEPLNPTMYNRIEVVK